MTFTTSVDKPANYKIIGDNNMLSANTVFELKIHGINIIAITIDSNEIKDEEGNHISNKWLCYGQNRLFNIFEYPNGYVIYDKIIVDYCNIPVYDREMIKVINDNKKLQIYYN